jgi:hypothetical protein
LITQLLASEGITTAAALGEALYRLNLCAVEAPRGSCDTPALPHQTYTYSPEESSPEAVVKALQSWRYQCERGLCNRAPLYQIMTAYMHHLAIEIVMGLREYDRAQWG